MQLGEVLLLMTRGFQFETPQPAQRNILEKGLDRINPKAPDFIVFDPKAKKERIEDEGRSVIFPSEAKEKIYVKLDDYGSKEALSENCGYPVNTRFAVTFMLAEEY